MKKIVVAMVSCLLVLVAYAVIANTTEPAKNPPVDSPSPQAPTTDNSRRREFPIGHPANPASPR